AACDERMLLPRRQGDAAAEHLRRLGGDAVEQPAVRRRHREHAAGAPAVEQRPEGEAAAQASERALRLEGDQELRLADDRLALDPAPESLEVGSRQVDAAAAEVVGE